MEMREDIDQNKEEIAAQKRRMEKLENKIEDLDPAKIIEQSRDSMLKELRERATRKDNLVIYQVEEPEMDRGHERKEYDMKKVIEIFEFMACPMTKEGIKFIFRVGERKEDRPGPRPIIVCLKDPGARNYILENTRRLASSRYERISVTPDLTPLQRKEEDDLRKEAVTRNINLSEEERLNFEWVLVGIKGQRSLIKRRKHHRDGGAQRRGGEGGGGAREGNGRRREPVPTVEPPRGRETARQLAMAEGERERERLREVVREKQKEKEKNSSQPTQSEKEQEAEEAENATTEPVTQESLDEPSGIMDIEEEEEDSEGDSQSETEAEEVQNTGTTGQNGRDQRKRGQKEASLSPPTQTQKRKT